MLKNVMKIAAVGAMMLGASSMEASAFPATAQTGETVGLARGAPLPEGVYFVNTLSWGVRNTNPDTKLLVDIPVIAWSTPWTILGGNFQLLGALPNAHVDAAGGADNYGLYNPFAAAALAWDLGNGFGVSYLSGFYFNAGDKNIRVRATTWRQDFAASYTGDGWNLTANLLWGITFDTDKSVGGKTANGFNLDLTATKTFGKWELGLAAFGSTEYDTPGGRPKQKQFALGPLVGYNFGPVIMQAYLTRDVWQRNLGGKETRLWTRVIIPLWTPAAPAPIVTKY
ncbi:transporter [Hansschlegelia beijingensis]|uniref:transporter n=1 Tax=Hansschlegelia beijingensis TaxID=1133344 RepID=UPI003814270A